MVTTKLYLDARYAKPGAAAPLKVAVTKKGSTAYIPLGVSLLPSQWDKAALKVVGHPRRQFLNSYIARRKVEIDEAVMALAAAGRLGGSVSEVRRRLLDALSPEDDEPSKPADLFADWLDRYTAAKSGRTRQLYVATRRRIEAFAADSLPTLRLPDISIDWLTRFDAFLAATSKSRNARNIHFRNIRTVFNYAIDNEATAWYPFRKFKLHNTPTRKRSMRVEQLRAVMAADVEPWLLRYRDFFSLSFMLIGINVADICNLQEITDGRVEYVRAKTHKPYSIKVEPEAMAIIDRYRGERQLLNYLDTNSSYRTFYMSVCRGLAALKKAVNANGAGLRELTTYWARHTWATIAASLDIPKETIAAALGHSMGNSTTAIYIDFNSAKIDEANRRVLDWVLYGKR